MADKKTANIEKTLKNDDEKMIREVVKESGEVLTDTKRGPSGLEEISIKGERRGISLIWPFILISAGFILLFNYFNILPWSVWGVAWRFWPVILILGGFEIFLRKTIWHAFFQILGGAVVIILASIFILGLYFQFRQEKVSESPFNFLQLFYQITGPLEEKTKELTVSQNEYSNLEKINLEVKLGSQELNLSTDNSDDLFYSKAVYNTSNFEPTLTKSQVGKDLFLIYETQENQISFFNVKGEYEIKLSQAELLTDLTIGLDSGKGNLNCENLNLEKATLTIGSGKLEADFGSQKMEKVQTVKATVGSGKLELKNLSSIASSHLNVDVGSGRSTLSFGGEIDKGDFLVTVNVGSGKILIEIPEDIGIKVSYKIGSGNLTVGDLKTSDDGVYTSPNYTDAESKINLDLVVGSGSVEVATL